VAANPEQAEDEEPGGDELEEAVDDMDADADTAEEHREDLDVGLPPAGRDPMGGPAPSG
jgi:hypothetical protein